MALWVWLLLATLGTTACAVRVAYAEHFVERPAQPGPLVFISAWVGICMGTWFVTSAAVFGLYRLAVAFS